MKSVVILSTLLFFSLGGLFLLGFKWHQSQFVNLSEAEKHQTIIAQRDLAIQKAIAGGDYHCCITPPCTMCYMEANRWNDFEAGTCGCDKLIAEGEEPCPQCGREFCEDSKEAVEGTTCELDSI
jgi:hypothetical protein